MLLTTTSGQIYTVIMLIIATFCGWLARDVQQSATDANGIPEDFPNDEESRDMFGNRDLGDA